MNRGVLRLRHVDGRVPLLPPQRHYKYGSFRSVWSSSAWLLRLDSSLCDFCDLVFSFDSENVWLWVRKQLQLRQRRLRLRRVRFWSIWDYVCFPREEFLTSYFPGKFFRVLWFAFSGALSLNFSKQIIPFVCLRGFFTNLQIDWLSIV